MASERFTLPILLIVSDNPSIRYWLKRRLETQFHLIQAERKGKAVETALNSMLDLVIIDANFEDGDALEVSRAIRKTPSNALTPILLITDTLKKTYRTAALDAGVTDFLFQPLDEDELETRIATGKKAIEVRHKVSDLSSRISTPAKGAPSTFFKNKVLLHDQALHLLADSRKKQIPVTMLIVRVDRFQEIHSKFGFATSQEILQSFSDLLSRAGEQAMVVPFSDGQFIILLPGKELEASQKVAENLRKLVEQQRFSTKQGPLHLTASFAVSSVETSEKSFDRMIDAASKSLQQSASLSNKIFTIRKEKP